MSVDLIRVSIPNWQKFNPRSDRANYTWFRMQNDFLHDPRVFQLTDAQVRLLIFVLSEASKKNRDAVEFLPQYVASICKARIADIRKNIAALCTAGLLAANSRLSAGEEPALLPATNERTNERNERDVTGLQSFDFEEIWKEYPRKIAKTDARDRFEKVIEGADDFEALKKAVANYAAECQAKKTEEKYIKHFASFLGTPNKQTWRDWVDHAVQATPSKSGSSDDPALAAARAAVDVIVANLPKFGRDAGERAMASLPAVAARLVERLGGWRKVHEMADQNGGVKVWLKAQWAERGRIALQADAELGGAA